MDNGNELKKETAVITELRTQKSESKLKILYVKLGFPTSYVVVSFFVVSALKATDHPTKIRFLKSE